MGLVDGELPAYPIFVVDSVPVNTFSSTTSSLCARLTGRSVREALPRHRWAGSLQTGLRPYGRPGPTSWPVISRCSTSWSEPSELGQPRHPRRSRSGCRRERRLMPTQQPMTCVTSCPRVSASSGAGIDRDVAPDTCPTAAQQAARQSRPRRSTAVGPGAETSLIAVGDGPGRARDPDDACLAAHAGTLEHAQASPTWTARQRSRERSTSGMMTARVRSPRASGKLPKQSTGAPT